MKHVIAIALLPSALMNAGGDEKIQTVQTVKNLLHQVHFGNIAIKNKIDLLSQNTVEKDMYLQKNLEHAQQNVLQAHDIKRSKIYTQESEQILTEITKEQDSFLKDLDLRLFAHILKQNH